MIDRVHKTISNYSHIFSRTRIHRVLPSSTPIWITSDIGQITDTLRLLPLVLFIRDSFQISIEFHVLNMSVVWHLPRILHVTAVLPRRTIVVNVEIYRRFKKVLQTPGFFFISPVSNLTVGCFFPGKKKIKLDFFPSIRFKYLFS